MSVDIAAIAEAVSGLPLVGNEEGLIPAFGLYLTRHYAAYYNRAEFGLLHHVERHAPDRVADAEAALVDAGHQCAFNTFGGIMLSQEWDAVVGPMLESREDWVHGIIGVINALGWGIWSVDRLDPGERLEVSIEGAYETVGYLADYGPRDDARGICYLATGGVAGIMNLLYVGDITERPALTPAYYDQVFANPARFAARQVESVVGGADRDRFVAARLE